MVAPEAVVSEAVAAEGAKGLIIIKRAFAAFTVYLTFFRDKDIAYRSWSALPPSLNAAPNADPNPSLIPQLDLPRR